MKPRLALQRALACEHATGKRVYRPRALMQHRNQRRQGPHYHAVGTGAGLDYTECRAPLIDAATRHELPGCPECGGESRPRSRYCSQGCTNLAGQRARRARHSSGGNQ